VNPPRATYRVQLRPEFGFEAVAALVPYLARLGVSHLYASPYLQAAPGSTHGYDVVDPSRVNEELGGEEGHRRLLEHLDRAGLGQVLDIVPNHMAIAGRHNRWWFDVLENGASSQYASYFDVSWDPPEPRLRNLILVPVLGDHYGSVLERGELQLARSGGSLLVRYFEHEFPVAFSSIDTLLETAAGRSHSLELEQLAEECRELPELRVGEIREAESRHRAKESIRERLARLMEQRQEARDGLDGVIAWTNKDPNRLDGLLDRQHYRLARWQTAADDLDYRRFFDINELVAVRVEESMVFEATHELVLKWTAEGVVDGLRIDHPDGLRDPEGYFTSLHGRAPQAWVVIEKILQRGERLPSSWPVAGTTGYEFLNLVLGLFVDPAGERPLTRAYQRFSGEDESWEDASYKGRLYAIDHLLGADLRRLTAVFMRVCEANRRFRDFTRREVRETIGELVASFPVYRTYVRPELGRVTDADRIHVDAAVAAARARRPDLDAELFGFIADVLLLRHSGLNESEFVSRFQQTTGPVMAKGVEDTAFYTYNRLVALNEVGGDPGVMGCSAEQFHEAIRDAATRRPLAMLATSTHDTKRSEDVRARLALLSEVPDEWTRAVSRWSAMNARHRRADLPDRNAEYLYYQALVGAHPVPVERATAYMEKAAREAKRHTSWLAPNADYEAAVRGFVEGTLADEEFIADLAGFVRPLLMAGWMNALSMKLIALTAPGVPDLYQGSELWDLSLVDPDNRRPVDYELRARLLDEVEGGLTADEAWRRLDEGLPKLLVTHRALKVRAEVPAAFQGPYQPLAVQGPRSEHLVAFARDSQVVTLAPRLVIGLTGGWGATEVELPTGHWRDEFTGREFEGGQVPVDQVLEAFPVGLLVRR
jgi:(1->4)-alpha-D-glucan 1-alpha-D-glucosylmutase